MFDNSREWCRMIGGLVILIGVCSSIILAIGIAKAELDDTGYLVPAIIFLGSLGSFIAGFIVYAIGCFIEACVAICDLAKKEKPINWEKVFEENKN